MFETAQEWLIVQGLNASQATPILRVGLGLVVLVLSWLTGVIARRIIRNMIQKMVVASSTDWDDIALEYGVFNHLLRLIPALMIQLLIAIPLTGLPEALSLVRTGIHIYMLVVMIFVIDSILNSALAIYRKYPVAKRFNLMAVIQVFKIIVYIIISILILSMLLNRSPLALLSGIGAMTAVILIVFKDALLGFVAGIQLTANNMVRRGDWIAMPKYGADGTVQEIALTTVKVQNWDKTITTVPTYALISDSFKNWRGMEESGGRRIKRSIAIDMTSVRICDSDMIDRFRRIAYISDYIDGKLTELAAWNAEHGVVGDDLINGRRLTNLGIFRAYVEAYLRHHPMIHQEMTFLVRQLQPNEKGLPIEIYVFSKDQRWVQYEGIQSDVFDHIIAVVSEFELRVFQQPTGQDVVSLLDQRPGVTDPS
ncbi:MAG: mechanosensitive ion channel [bacterium]|nr:mechanosensitive ion channel [bacterium]